MKMQFTSREDVHAPIDFVFQKASDFEDMAKLARAKGVVINRSDTLQAPGVGMAWEGHFTFRGRKREFAAKVAEYSAPDNYTVTADSDGFEITAIVELVEVKPGLTRMKVDIGMKPKNVTARLFLQSVKLAKTQLMRRYRRRIAEYANGIEGSFTKAA
jgi:carbon monoxide dehydrogenase subunit G